MICALLHIYCITEGGMVWSADAKTGEMAWHGMAWHGMAGAARRLAARLLSDPRVRPHLHHRRRGRDLRPRHRRKARSPRPKSPRRESPGLSRSLKGLPPPVRREASLRSADSPPLSLWLDPSDIGSPHMHALCAGQIGDVYSCAVSLAG